MTGPRGPRGRGSSVRRRPRVAGQPVGRRSSLDAGEELGDGIDAPESVPDSVDAGGRDALGGSTAPSRTVAEPRDDIEPAPGQAAAKAASPAPAPETESHTLVRKHEPEADAAAPRGKQRQPAARVSTIKPKRASDTGPARRPFPVSSRRRERSFKRRLIGVVAALAVVAGLIAGIAAIQPGVSLSSNEAFVDSALTSEVIGQAKTRICTVFAVNYAKLDEWQRVARANLTGEAARRFDQLVSAARSAITQSGVTNGAVDCRPDVVGVRTISGDSASLVANLILSQTQDQQASGSGTKRYEVSMNRVNGQWLISNFADF